MNSHSVGEFFDLDTEFSQLRDDSVDPICLFVADVFDIAHCNWLAGEGVLAASVWAVF